MTEWASKSPWAYSKDIIFKICLTFNLFENGYTLSTTHLVWLDHNISGVKSDWQVPCWIIQVTRRGPWQDDTKTLRTRVVTATMVESTDDFKKYHQCHSMNALYKNMNGYHTVARPTHATVPTSRAHNLNCEQAPCSLLSTESIHLSAPKELVYIYCAKGKFSFGFYNWIPSALN